MIEAQRKITMNPKKKSKAHSDFSKASATEASLPFELSQIAIALCQLDKKERQGYGHQPDHYFRAAKRLLDEARDYLETDWNEHWDNVKDTLFDLIPKNKTFTFDELLEPSGEISKGKKSRTRLGAITTPNGLKKAIRHYFSKPEAARIIKDRAMSGKQFHFLKAAQKAAVEQRAAKRVKRASAEKIQST
jgi:hypothetical protein